MQKQCLQIHQQQFLGSDRCAKLFKMVYDSILPRASVLRPQPESHPIINIASTHVRVPAETTEAQFPLALSADDMSDEPSSIQKFLNPDKEETPDDFEMPIWDHLEELRERVLVALLACAASVLTCFCFSKDLVVFLEAPVADAGVWHGPALASAAQERMQ